MQGSKPGERRGGRKAGTPNKKTQVIEEILASLNCDPIKNLARIANGERIMSLAYANKETGEFVESEVMPTIDQIKDANKELANYVYPKRKAMEHSGSIGTHEETLDDLA